MSTEEQKPVEVPKEEVAAPAAEPVVAEAAPATETPAVEAPAAETTADVVAEAPAAEAAAATEAPKEEDKKEEPKEEIKPIEEGVLEHRKGAGFPKNLISTKHTFWFGAGSIEKDALAAYLKAEKSAEVAFHNAAWATKTGAGLFLYGDKKDSIAGIINLADSEEPEADGNSKLHLTTKGTKHTFKAPTKAERDSWVAQLKIKIAEAKEAVATVTESEEYKSALETLKTKTAKKEEKKEDKPAEETAAVVAKEEDKVAEAPKEEGAAVAAETPKAEEPAAESSKALEEPKDAKRRSTSRKRFSVFGLNKGKKEDKKDEATSPTEPAPVVEETPAEETPAAEVPAVAAAETPAVEAAPAAETPAVEDKPAEEKKEEEAAAPVKPAATKRNSFFDVFRPKKAPAATPPADAAPVVEEPTEVAAETPAPVAETAPVIPPVDTGAAPAEATPAVAAETPAAEEPSAPTEKQEIKAEKRKSSLPFLGGKKDKSPTEETNEKSDKVPLFSRLRQTIKRHEKVEKPAEKSEEKVEEKPAEEKKAEETPAEAVASSSEVPAPVEPIAEEAPKPEAPAAIAPVTAAA